MEGLARLSWMGNEINLSNVKYNENLPEYEESKDVNNDHNGYEEEENESESNYLKRILSMTSIQDETDDPIKKKLNGTISNETTDQNNIEADSLSVDELANHLKHDLYRSDLNFPWTPEKDFGHFEVTYFDRPAAADRIANILESILEENRIEKEFLRITNPYTVGKGQTKTGEGDKSIDQFKTGDRSPTSGRNSRDPSPSIIRTTETNDDYRNAAENINANNTGRLQEEQSIQQSSLKIPSKTEQNLKSPVLKGDWSPSRPSSKATSIVGTNSRPLSSVHKGEKEQRKKKKKKVKKVTADAKNDHPPSSLQKVMRDTITQHFAGKEYYIADELKHNCSVLADLIKMRVKYFYQPRYRIICIVSVIESKKQQIKMVSRGLWDTSRDTFTECCVNFGGYFVTALIYGIYKE